MSMLVIEVFIANLILRLRYPGENCD